MKININKTPNYLEETISLIVQVMGLKDTFELDSMHIVKTPQNFSVPIEELDSMYSDVLEYKRALIRDSADLINSSCFPKLNILTTTAAGFKSPYLTSLFWEMNVTDAEKLTDTNLLSTYLNLLLNDYYVKYNLDIKSMLQKDKLSYRDSYWCEDSIDIKLEDIIDLISNLDYEESLKWFVLNQISNKDNRKEFIQNLREVQKVVKTNFYLVEDRFNESIKNLGNSEEIIIRLNNLFGERIENVQGIIDSPTLFLSVISYGAASIKSVINKNINDAIFLGILVEDLNSYRITDISIVEKCKAIGDPMRYKMLSMLSEKQYYVKELAEILNISSSTLSHHLSILSENGFLTIEILDRKTFYKVRPESFKELSDYFKILSESVKED